MGDSPKNFELEIANKISHFPHYPNCVKNLGGLYLNSYCRIPGIQPFKYPMFYHPTTENCLSSFCFEYGKTRFPTRCDCNEKYGCFKNNCINSCGSCNHNSNVIYF